MNIFDIIGPVMIGPSSSHTAGAVRIGYIARKLMNEPITNARILLYGSFLTTGKGHGTPLALVAGLLGMKPDDSRIPESFSLASQAQMNYSFGEAHLKEGHPNSVQLILTGKSGKNMEIVGESLGGSRINIAKIDGLSVNIKGEYPTLIVHNEDQPGCVAEISATLSRQYINIASMHLYRSSRGGSAIMVIECDQEISPEFLHMVEGMAGIEKVTYLSLSEESE